MKALFAKLTTAQSTEESQAEQERLVRVVLTMITLCMIPITIIIAFFLAAGIFQQSALVQVLGVDILAAIGWLLVSRRRIQLTEGLIIACFFLLAAYGSYSKGLVTAGGEPKGVETFAYDPPHRTAGRFLEKKVYFPFR